MSYGLVEKFLEVLMCIVVVLVTMLLGLLLVQVMFKTAHHLGWGGSVVEMEAHTHWNCGESVSGKVPTHMVKGE